MVTDRRDPLDGVGRLVVDGTNVLHALRRSPEPLPEATLIGRLRAIVPPNVGIVLVLDGAPGQGLVSRRVASGVEVRYSGRETADRVIERLCDERRSFAVDVPAADTLVVTDDADLTHSLRRLGARTVRNTWLIGQLRRQRLSSPAPGRPRPPVPQPPEEGEAEEGSRWSPGRGATRKRGNPRRSPKHG